MKKWIFTNLETLQFIFISTIGVYIAIIILTKIFGKRSFSKMSSFDFACTIAIGSVIASTLISKSVSLLEGVFGLLVIYSLQNGTAYLRRYKHFRSVVDNKPLFLMIREEILWDNLKKARVTEGDLRAKLREANVIELSEVKAVIFETTGDISVLHSSEDKNIDDWIVEDVANK
ncbi:DUF421 domain-containing protein [Polaribacter haliotis]|uniref:DUF421 domain-containing protein n=1 Tax=Polaribacter haliotis TaxID=1888915 RepID=A0A7L8ACJ3_9FLAO|nr:YetF domain-containing protein [Polaribacter haliotis]QOD59599.1 DUF421 domain-containing protein [Polaribacter haliotis]